MRLMKYITVLLKLVFLVKVQCGCSADGVTSQEASLLKADYSPPHRHSPDKYQHDAESNEFPDENNNFINNFDLDHNNTDFDQNFGQTDSYFVDSFIHYDSDFSDNYEQPNTYFEGNFTQNDNFVETLDQNFPPDDTVGSRVSLGYSFFRSLPRKVAILSRGYGNKVPPITWEEEEEEEEEEDDDDDDDDDEKAEQEDKEQEQEGEENEGDEKIQQQYKAEKKEEKDYGSEGEVPGEENVFRSRYTTTTNYKLPSREVPFSMRSHVENDDSHDDINKSDIVRSLQPSDDTLKFSNSTIKNEKSTYKFGYDDIKINDDDYNNNGEKDGNEEKSDNDGNVIPQGKSGYIHKYNNSLAFDENTLDLHPPSSVGRIIHRVSTGNFNLSEANVHTGTEDQERSHILRPLNRGQTNTPRSNTHRMTIHKANIEQVDLNFTNDDPFNSYNSNPDQISSNGELAGTFSVMHKSNVRLFDVEEHSTANDGDVSQVRLIQAANSGFVSHTEKERKQLYKVGAYASKPMLEIIMKEEILDDDDDTEDDETYRAEDDEDTDDRQTVETDNGDDDDDDDDKDRYSDDNSTEYYANSSEMYFDMNDNKGYYEYKCNKDEHNMHNDKEGHYHDTHGEDDALDDEDDDNDEKHNINDEDVEEDDVNDGDNDDDDEKNDTSNDDEDNVSVFFIPLPPVNLPNKYIIPSFNLPEKNNITLTPSVQLSSSSTSSSSCFSTITSSSSSYSSYTSSSSSLGSHSPGLSQSQVWAEVPVQPHSRHHSKPQSPQLPVSVLHDHQHSHNRPQSHPGSQSSVQKSMKSNKNFSPSPILDDDDGDDNDDDLGIYDRDSNNDGDEDDDEADHDDIIPLSLYVKIPNTGLVPPFINSASVSFPSKLEPSRPTRPTVLRTLLTNTDFTRYSTTLGESSRQTRLRIKGNYGITPSPLYLPPKDSREYQFSYTVSHHDNQYGHQEARRGAHVTGSYHVILPGGIKQVVKYYADDSGYHPTVTYEPAYDTDDIDPRSANNPPPPPPTTTTAATQQKPSTQHPSLIAESSSHILPSASTTIHRYFSPHRPTYYLGSSSDFIYPSNNSTSRNSRNSLSPTVMVTAPRTILNPSRRANSFFRQNRRFLTPHRHHRTISQVDTRTKRYQMLLPRQQNILRGGQSHLPQNNSARSSISRNKRQPFKTFQTAPYSDTVSTTTLKELIGKPVV